MTEKLDLRAPLPKKGIQGGFFDTPSHWGDCGNLPWPLFSNRGNLIYPCRCSFEIACLYRPQSCFVASRAPSAIDWNFAQATCG